MKKIYFLALITAAVLFMAYQNGPLPENTGAPNEMTCYRSTCHVNNGAGKASVFLQLNDSSTTYQNMDTLLLEFGFDKVFSNEHGFQMVALDTLNKNVGQWFLDGSIQYQQISGFSFPGRKYLEHIAPGTSSNSWQVKWVAPDSYQGEITFYASFLETNDDNFNTGDTLYNSTFSMNYDAGIGQEELNNRVKPFYTSSSNNRLKFHNTSAQPLDVQVFTLIGKQAHSFRSNAGSVVPLVLPSGMYFLAVEGMERDSFISEKILVP